jgi:glycosyltransferase involved in cell wall biosynthesis
MKYSSAVPTHKDNSTLAVIIPAFNEVATVAVTINSFLLHSEVTKVVLIDNNSSDGTLELAQGMAKKNPNLLVLRELKQGKGYAVRKAFRNIDADYYVMVDADSTYSSDDLHKLLNVAKTNEIDLVTGNRLANRVYVEQNSRRFHNFGNHLIKRIINQLYGSNLEDILSGYRVMSRSFVQSFPIQARGFELETEITLHALDRGYSMAEVPITYMSRPDGSQSKLRTFYDGRKIIFRIIKIYRIFQPMKFFGSISFIFFSAAMWFGSKPINDFVKFEYVYHIPSAILSSALIILSSLALMTAFILDAVADLSTKNFEMHQNKVKYEKK